MPVTPNLGLRLYGAGDVVDWASINETLNTLDSTGAGEGFIKAYAVKANGDVAAGGLADVTGLSVTFDTVRSVSIVEARFHAAYAVNTVSGFTVVISIDGTEYEFPLCDISNGAGGDYVNKWPGSCGVVVPVTAGTHTVKIRQAGSNATLLANSTNYATLVVDYQY